MTWCGCKYLIPLDLLVDVVVNQIEWWKGLHVAGGMRFVILVAPNWNLKFKVAPSNILCSQVLTSISKKKKTNLLWYLMQSPHARIPLTKHLPLWLSASVQVALLSRIATILKHRNVLLARESRVTLSFSMYRFLIVLAARSFIGKRWPAKQEGK